MATVYNPMADLAPALSSIAGGVAQMINPFHNLQVAVRNKIAEDPALAQNLADLNDASPGLLDSLGLGKVGKEIAKIPPTPAQIIRRNTQSALEKASSNQTNANINATKQVTNMSPAEVQLETATSNVLRDPGVAVTAGLKGATGMTPDQYLTSKVTAQNIDEAQKYIVANPTVGANKIVDSVIDGSMPLSQAAPLFNSPYGKAVGDMFNLRMHQEDIKAMGQWRLSGKADQYDDAMDRLRTTRAAIAWQAMGMQGNPETLKQIMFDPATQKHAMDLMADPTKIKSVEDQQLYDAEKGIQNFNQANRAKQMGAAAATLRVMTDTFTKNVHGTGTTPPMDPESQSAALLGIQDQLNLRAAFGAQQLTVHYGKVPGKGINILGYQTGSESLYFTDDKGKVVSPALATSPTGISTDLSNKVNRAYVIYQQSSPADRQKMLNMVDPEIRRLILQRVSPSPTPMTAPSADTGDQQ